jgi:hypothetical protein
MLFLRFDLKLTQFGVDVAELQANPKNMYEECRCVNDPVAKAQILNKYKGLKFFEVENNLRQVMSATELEWHRKNEKDTNSYTG